jgi:hypothetical protein
MYLIFACIFFHRLELRTTNYVKLLYSLYNTFPYGSLLEAYKLSILFVNPIFIVVSHSNQWKNMIFNSMIVQIMYLIFACIFFHRLELRTCSYIDLRMGSNQRSCAFVYLLSVKTINLTATSFSNIFKRMVIWTIMLTTKKKLTLKINILKQTLQCQNVNFRSALKLFYPFQICPWSSPWVKNKYMYLYNENWFTCTDTQTNYVKLLYSLYNTLQVNQFSLYKYMYLFFTHGEDHGQIWNG